MELAAVFDPTTETGGSFTASTLQTGSTMIIINKSYVDLIFTFANGDRRLVIANDRRAFQFSDASVVANGIIQWTQDNIDYPQTINQLENIVYVEVYGATEKVVETYPSNVVRETLPSLIPYDIGFSTYQLFYTTVQQPTSVAGVVWPSSYYGVTCAPFAAGGMGFDHFWVYNNPATSSTMLDTPGQYASTGKTGNNATLNNASLASLIPGPFSRPGLTPVDSATYLNGTYWTCQSVINWDFDVNGFLVDAWVNPAQYVQYILGDDNPAFNQKGVYILINTDGTIHLSVGNGTTHTVVVTNSPLPLNQWTYVACLYIPSNSSLQIYLNGQLSASASFTGPVATTTEVLSIGRDTRDNITSTSFVGSITNVGILLTSPYGTRWGTDIVQARYQLGLQSLDVDMQSAWIKSVFLTIFNNSANASLSAGQVTMDNVFNPGGLLYAGVAAAITPLHLYAINATTLDFIFPAISGNSVYQQNFAFDNPITHYVLNFPTFNISYFANPTIFDTLVMQVNGYNILGIR